MRSLTCKIPSTSRPYEIEIQSGLMNNLTELTQKLDAFGSRFAIITQAPLAELYGETLCHALLERGLEAFLFAFPAGEQYKTRQTKEHLEDQMFEKGLGRDTCLIAMGGGVATDLGGYIAATYCRGIPLIMIPTSLLGMVDASIGGKVGVNVPHGKNLIGSIYQPCKVLIDPMTLQSLPLRELRNGLVEMIKHGLIVDRSYFEYLEQYSKELLELDPKIIEKAIFESCLIKKTIIEQDEREGGKRNLLNFGHTVGHALEKLSDYSLAHGEAVAIGIVVESHIAVQLGHFKASDLERIQQIFAKGGLPLKLPKGLNAESILQAMSLDKKSLKGHPRFVIIQEIGFSVECGGAYCKEVDENIIKNALQWMLDDLCCH